MINEKIDLKIKNTESYKNDYPFEDLVNLVQLVSIYTGLSKEEAEKRVIYNSYRRIS